MNKLRTAFRLIKENKKIFFASLLENVNFLFPDKLYLRLMFFLRMGYKLNLVNPRSFSEKIQWLKLYNRNPLYTTLVDKCAVKEYVAKIIGEEYVISSLGVWDNAKNIDFDSLPNQFVLKTTNGGGGDVVICKDKKLLDQSFVIRQLNNGLKKSIYNKLREWPYKNVKPRIIAERYLSANESGLYDYKVHCFNGNAKFVLVCSERYSKDGLKEDFYDLDWNLMPVSRPKHKNSGKRIPRPDNFEKMIEVAEKFSSEIPFLRVDFYEVDKRLFFGELTFYPASGFEKFNPESWDYIFGDYLLICKGLK